jgi:hypothetical protein
MKRFATALCASVVLCGCQLEKDDALAGAWRNVDDGALLVIADDDAFRYETRPPRTGIIELEPFDTFRLREGEISSKGYVLCAFCRRDGDEIACARPLTASDGSQPARECRFRRSAADAPLAKVVSVTTGAVLGASLADDTLYWQDGAGNVRKKRLSDGAETSLAQAPAPALSSDRALGPIASATHVYWANNRANGGIYRAPTAGGTLETLASGASYPHTVAINASTVAWSVNPGTIRAAPLAGGNAVTVANTSQHVDWLEVDETRAYWSSVSDVFSAPLDGSGAVTTFAPGPATNLFRRDTTLYWTRNDEVWSAELPGGTPARVVSAPEVASAGALFVDLDAFYLAYWPKNVPRQTIQRIDRTTGQSTRFVDGESYVRFAGADAKRIYWWRGASSPSGILAAEKP